MRALMFRTVPISDTKVYLSSFAETILVFSVFTKEIGSARIFGIDFDFVAYPFAIFYLLGNIHQIISFPSVPWKFYLYLFITSLISIAGLQLGFGGFLKQMVPIFIIFTVNAYIIGKYDWRNVFKLYVKFAYFSAIFGIIQVILSFGELTLLSKFLAGLILYLMNHLTTLL